MRESWYATGLVEPLWQRLGVDDGRDELARRTGIPGTNLSSMNTGKRRMTMNMARRIVAQVPGSTVLELGAPIRDADPAGQSFLAHLEALAEKVAHLLNRDVAVTAELADVRTRLAKLENARKRPPNAAKQ